MFLQFFLFHLALRAPHIIYLSVSLPSRVTALPALHYALFNGRFSLCSRDSLTRAPIVLCAGSPYSGKPTDRVQRRRCIMNRTPSASTVPAAGLVLRVRVYPPTPLHPLAAPTRQQYRQERRYYHPPSSCPSHQPIIFQCYVTSRYVTLASSRVRLFTLDAE